MAAVMASDSQILALSTMFTEDGSRTTRAARFGEAAQINMGRAFVVGLTVGVPWLRAPESISRSPSSTPSPGPPRCRRCSWRPLLAGSTKWGALACTLVAAEVIAVALFQAAVPAPAPGPPVVVARLGGFDPLSRTPGGTAVLGFMPVVPMVLVSALLMIVVSALTPKPSATTIARYFPPRPAA
jgi:Na+/proline symporter